jgi:hypothetical protein
MLSGEGKVWLDRALFNLQAMMEKELMSIRGYGLESNNDAFQDFAFDSHVPAYEKAGLFSLPFSDLYIIGLTPDYADLLSEDGRRQMMQIAYDYAIYCAVQAQNHLENATKPPQSVEYWRNKSNSSVFQFDFLFRIPGFGSDYGY